MLLSFVHNSDYQIQDVDIPGDIKNIDFKFIMPNKDLFYKVTAAQVLVQNVSNILTTVSM